MNKKQKEIELLKSVMALFMKFGIKSLTMDDIARHLGISKKTLYLSVSDKKELVCKGMEMMIKGEQQLVCGVIEESKTAIDEMIGMTKCVSAKLGEIHPSVLYDLQKYHPKGWAIMEKHKSEFIHGIILANLKRGIKEGYYRKNLNPEVIANIYLTMMGVIMNSENSINKNIAIAKLHLEVINYHLSGISNKKGLDYLQAVIKKEQLIILSID